MKKPSSDPSAARERLERIARTLGRPASAFFSVLDDPSREAETLAIVRAFDRIKDPQIRTRCLAFVAAEAERS